MLGHNPTSLSSGFAGHKAVGPPGPSLPAWGQAVLMHDSEHQQFLAVDALPRSDVYVRFCCHSERILQLLGALGAYGIRTVTAPRSGTAVSGPVWTEAICQHSGSHELMKGLVVKIDTSLSFYVTFRF